MDNSLIKILLIEDNEDDFVLTRLLLSKIQGSRFDLAWAANYSDALQAMAQKHFDVCLLDYRLGAHNGLDLLRDALARGCKAPIIVLTGQQDRKVDLEAMKAGAADYLIKGQIDAPLLERSIRYATERKKVEQALRQSEMRFRSVTQSAQDAIISADQEGRIISWNMGAEIIFGYKEEEVRDKSLMMLIPEHYRDAHSRSLERALSRTQSELMGKTVELRGLRRDKREFPLELSLSTWSTEEGTFYSGIIRDITKRKQVEEAFRRKTVFLQLLQEVTVAANEASTVTGALQICLDRVCARTGWPVAHAYTFAKGDSKELVSTALWHVDDPKRYQSFREIREARRFASEIGLPGRVLASREPEWMVDSSAEAGFADRLGTSSTGLKAAFAIPVLVGKEVVAVLEFFCEKALEPDYQLLEVMVHLGAQLGRVFERMQAKEMLYKAYDELEMRVRKRTEDLAKANTDLQAEINERKRSELALSHLAAIVESSGDAITGATLAGTILSWNSGAERIYGYAAGEVKGRSLSILVPPEISQEELQILEKIARGEKVHRYETVQMKKDSQRIHVSLTISPINEVGGRVIGASIIARDITERKRAEAQLTASLKEKEVLLKEIHHRVKNNLQIISSLLNLQSHYIEDPRALGMFKESQNRVKSMALIHEKLYQSKELSKIEFNEYVRNLLSMVFRSHSPASKTIDLDVQVDPVFLSVDMAVPVSLILNELVSNSLKHAFVKRKSGRVAIHFEKQQAGRYLLAVRDDGVGLPKDFALEDTSSLGLRLVKILTDQLGGELTFQSEEGTEFKVHFGEQQV